MGPHGSLRSARACDLSAVCSSHVNLCTAVHAPHALAGVHRSACPENMPARTRSKRVDTDAMASSLLAVTLAVVPWGVLSRRNHINLASDYATVFSSA